MNTATDHFIPSSTARAGGGEVRLDSVRTSPFLSKLGSVLEKYLDIIGETYEFSPERPDGKATNFTLKRPRTFAGDGMAVTFPFHAGVGIFLISVRGGILPDWFMNPGIAGRSRLFLLASELEQIFATDWEKEPVTESEETLSPEVLEEIATQNLTQKLFQKPSPKTVSTTGTFYATADFFYGPVSDLETLFEGLAEEELTEFRAFSIRKFDGREGSAWMLGPTGTTEILRKNVPAETLPTRTLGTLRPVRSLESVIIDTPPTMPPESETISETISEMEIIPEIEEVLETVGIAEISEESETESVVELGEIAQPESSTISEILAEFPRTVYRFHFRSKMDSPVCRARREETILSQIHYENPIYTQRWRKRTERYLERLEAELQTAVLLAGSLYPLRRETQKEETQEQKLENSATSKNLSETLSGTVATLVETRLSDVKETEIFTPVETVDLSEMSFVSMTEWATEWVSPDMWVENPVVITRTFQPVEVEDSLKTKTFTAESLLESEKLENSVETGCPALFSVDFSQDVDVQITETWKKRVEETEMMKISVPVSVLVGRAKRSVAEILGWKVGDIINLGQKTEETSEVFINGGCAGRGFPVEWENRVGIRWLCRER